MLILGLWLIEQHSLHVMLGWHRRALSPSYGPSFIFDQELGAVFLLA